MLSVTLELQKGGSPCRSGAVLGEYEKLFEGEQKVGMRKKRWCKWIDFWEQRPGWRLGPSCGLETWETGYGQLGWGLLTPWETTNFSFVSYSEVWLRWVGHVVRSTFSVLINNNKERFKSHSSPSDLSLVGCSGTFRSFCPRHKAGVPAISQPSVKLSVSAG